MKRLILVLVFCTVSGTQPLHERHAETEGGRLPVDWNAQLEEKLIRELSKNNPTEHESLPDSVDLELELAKGGEWDGAPLEVEGQDMDDVLEQQHVHHVPVPIQTGGIQKKGQPEYMSFVDLSPSNSALKIAEPQQSEVKRANEASINRQLEPSSWADTVFMVTIVGGVACAMVGVIVAAVVVKRIHRAHDSARESDYPQYGVTGPGKDKKGGAAAGDAIGAYQAQLQHYKETKQKIISMEQSGPDGRDHESDESGDEQDEGDFSVYECPGLAPTGDIEVSNPMFENSNGSPKSKDVVKDGD